MDRAEDRAENRDADRDVSGDRAGAERAESYRATSGPAPSDLGAAVGGRQVAAKDAVYDLLESARGQGQEVAEKAASEVQGVAKALGERGVQALTEGKTQLAEQIDGVARALKRGSEQFRNDRLSSLAELSEGLAGQADEVQRYLNERDGETLLRDLKTLAREHRSLFVGSLFITGLIAARLVRPGSSPHPSAATSRRAGRRRWIVRPGSTGGGVASGSPYTTSTEERDR